MVLVVLMVLEELVVLVGGIYENSISPIKKEEEFIEFKKKIFGAKKNLKIIKTKSKIHLYFRVGHSSIPLLCTFSREKNSMAKNDACVNKRTFRMSAQ